MKVGDLVMYSGAYDRKGAGIVTKVYGHHELINGPVYATVHWCSGVTDMNLCQLEVISENKAQRRIK